MPRVLLSGGVYLSSCTLGVEAACFSSRSGSDTSEWQWILLSSYTRVDNGDLHSGNHARTSRVQHPPPAGVCVAWVTLRGLHLTSTQDARACACACHGLTVDGGGRGVWADLLAALHERDTWCVDADSVHRPTWPVILLAGVPPHRDTDSRLRSRLSPVPMSPALHRLDRGERGRACAGDLVEVRMIAACSRAEAAARVRV